MTVNLLIIEAENRFRKNLHLRLKAEGFRVHMVTPSDDIPTIINKEKIEVVLLGVDGLGKDGIALIEPIRAVNPNTEIIIINNSLHMDLSIIGMERGAFDDFLVPLDFDSLSKRIRQAASLKSKG